MGQFIIFILLLMTTHESWADKASTLSGQRSKTSDDIRINHIQMNFESNLTDLFWPYAGQDFEKISYGLDLKQLEITGPVTSFAQTLVAPQLTHFIDETLRIKYQLGLYHLDYFNQDDINKAKAKFEMKKKFKEVLFLDASLDRGYLFHATIPLAGHPDLFYGTQLDARVLYRFLESFDFSINNRSQFFSDQNQSSKNEFQLLYAIMRFPHWILIGLGGETLSFQQRSNNYWSPRFFRSLGPRIDLSLNVYKSLNYFLGGSYNFFKEDDFDQGTGFYGRSGLIWGDRNDWTVTLYAERNESTQNGQVWFNDSFGLVWSQVW